MEGAMDNWQSPFLGLKQLPRELTTFEIEAFFTFTLPEWQMIEDRRRPNAPSAPPPERARMLIGSPPRKVRARRATLCIDTAAKR
jgi:hypothetical protein